MCKENIISHIQGAYDKALEIDMSSQSQTLTLQPLLASKAAVVSPLGPDPIIAAIFPSCQLIFPTSHTCQGEL